MMLSQSVESHLSHRSKLIQQDMLSTLLEGGVTYMRCVYLPHTCVYVSFPAEASCEAKTVMRI